MLTGTIASSIKKRNIINLKDSQMKKHYFSSVIKFPTAKLLILLFLMGAIYSCSSITDSNNALNDEHFDFVLYGQFNTSDIAQISNNLNSNYGRIINDLKVQSMPKVTVKIWSDYNTFLDDMQKDIGIRYTGSTGYIFGMAEMRIYFTAQAPSTACHEFSHLVSMQVNSTIPNNPRWLWEAVALYENNEFVNPNSLTYMVSQNYPTLEELNMDYNSSNQHIYEVGYILLEYIVQTWGMDYVIGLIKNNGDIIGVLGINNQEFESGWYKFIEEKYLH